MLGNVLLRLAAVAAVNRVGGHEDLTTRPLAKAAVKRRAKEYVSPATRLKV